MRHLTPKRFTALLLITVLALAIINAIFPIAPSRPTASAHGLTVEAPLTDVEDNDLPTSTYSLHHLHLRPSTTPLLPMVFFHASGDGLPDLRVLTFSSDLSPRCSSNTFDGATVTTDTFGRFSSPTTFEADGCKFTGHYNLEATDLSTGIVYNADLTLT